MADEREGSGAGGRSGVRLGKKLAVAAFESIPDNAETIGDCDRVELLANVEEALAHVAEGHAGGVGVDVVRKAAAEMAGQMGTRKLLLLQALCGP